VLYSNTDMRDFGQPHWKQLQWHPWDLLKWSLCPQHRLHSELRPAQHRLPQLHLLSSHTDVCNCNQPDGRQLQRHCRNLYCWHLRCQQCLQHELHPAQHRLPQLHLLNCHGYVCHCSQPNRQQLQWHTGGLLCCWGVHCYKQHQHRYADAPASSSFWC